MIVLPLSRRRDNTIPLFMSPEIMILPPPGPVHRRGLSCSPWGEESLDHGHLGGGCSNRGASRGAGEVDSRTSNHWQQWLCMWVALAAVCVAKERWIIATTVQVGVQGGGEPRTPVCRRYWSHVEGGSNSNHTHMCMLKKV